MLALSGSLVDPLLDMYSQHVREELGHASQHLSGELSMRCCVIDVFSDGDESHALFS